MSLLLDQVRALLMEALDPSELEIEDESHLHVGHPGARDGRRHLRVRIRAKAFQDMQALTRHRLVYQTLGELMQTDIHALAIEAEPPIDVPTDL